MRRVLIADDEPLARRRLRAMLARHPSYEVVAECGDGPSAVDRLIADTPDVLFLDVKMPGLDGFEVLAALREVERPPAIVFVTAFADRAVYAFDESAADFLLKPFDAERFDRAVQRIEQRLAAGPAADGEGTRRALEAIPSAEIADRFLVRGVNHLYFVRAGDVEWIDAAANYVRLHVGGRVHFVRATVKDIESRLDPGHFVRVHRSAIVNLDFVQRLEPYEHGEYVITMRDGARVQSSRTYAAKLRRAMR
jgi:two-component system, LytTR family, response regulator